MEKGNMSAILNALGYTPKTLAADTGMSIYRARRVLNGGAATYGEYVAVLRATGIEPNILAGVFKPGEAREVTA